MMDVMAFLKEWGRMCKQNPSCNTCAIKAVIGLAPCKCWVTDNPEKAVEIVQKWAMEHPQKTMLQDFFEKFPKAKKCADGTPEICPSTVYGTKKDCCKFKKCVECWNSPLEGEINDRQR